MKINQLTVPVEPHSKRLQINICICSGRPMLKYESFCYYLKMCENIFNLMSELHPRFGAACGRRPWRPRLFRPLIYLGLPTFHAGYSVEEGDEIEEIHLGHCRMFPVLQETHLVHFRRYRT